MNVYDKRITAEGYVELYLPFHQANVDGWVLEHRVVMELKLGLRLPPHVHVHHRDLNPRNNAVDNLLLCSEPRIHNLLHDAIREGAPGRDRLLAVEKMCRDFERSVVVASEQHRTACFEAGERVQCAVPDDKAARSFMSSLPPATRDEVVRLRKGLPGPRAGRASQLERSFPRARAPWTPSERLIISVLHTHGARAQVIGSFLLRPPPSIEQQASHLKW